MQDYSNCSAHISAVGRYLCLQYTHVLKCKLCIHFKAVALPGAAIGACVLLSTSVETSTDITRILHTPISNYTQARIFIVAVRRNCSLRQK